MDWPLLMLIIIGSFLVVMFMGMPVAFSFLLINIIAGVILSGVDVGLRQLVLSMYSAITRFTLVPVIMFCLMGDVMFYSGVAMRMMDALGSLLGRLPGRLSLLAVMTATLFSTMSGSTIGTTAMLGETFLPQMLKRGYAKEMAIGPLMGSGGLAMLIPPTGLGVVLAVIAEVSIGRFLIAITVPGFLLAAVLAAYVVIRCWLQPNLAPAYDVARVPISQKLMLNLKYVLPLGLIIFLVLGLIYLGVATPSESAAMGTVGAFFLAFVYKGMNWNIFTKSILSATRLAGMIFLIIAGAVAFSQVLAFSGASRGLAQAVLNLPLSPIMFVIAMQIVGLILGCFMDPNSIIMICIPIFMPIINALHLDPIWFTAIWLLNMEIAQLSPPFAILAFVMKGIAPAGTTMSDIYRASIPFLLCDLLVLILMLGFPSIVLWLPNLMRGG